MKPLFMSALLAVLFVLPASADTKPAVKTEIKPVVVPFELVSSGHFIVKVKLNGHGPYNLIFDTGAPTTLISPRIAKDADLVGKAKDKPIIPLFGMMGNVKIKEFEVNGVKAEDVGAQIMDHPTVKLFSKEYEKTHGPIEGIVGFPFFSRFNMTVDYAAKTLTFTPNGFVGEDVMQAMMKAVMGASGTPAPKIVAPKALWGFAADKKADDEADGLDVTEVSPNTPAAKAGLKTGDRLLTVDGRWTDTIADLFTAGSLVKPGQGVAVTLKRDGKEMKLTLTPANGL
ncbi:PDZ domain-containing protein [Zavarzinella formosa]|uniref:PDZ domain-containing protein n=1 Tax=Zavarzinella formosa TaxID=360055 RepID=UPI00031B7136|nr:PDZ domain-containing protein [Zavarzinella formosa]